MRIIVIALLIAVLVFVAQAKSRPSKASICASLCFVQSALIKDGDINECFDNHCPDVKQDAANKALTTINELKEALTTENEDTVVEAESDSGNCYIQREFVYYNQCNDRWGHQKLGSSSTICKVGCLISSVAGGMASIGRTIVDADGVAKQATPRTLNTWLLANNGYSGNLFIWDSVRAFGLNYEGQTSDINVIRQHLCNNKIVILNVMGGGHWVLAKGYNGDAFYINDSGFGKDVAYAGEVVRAGIYSF